MTNQYTAKIKAAVHQAALKIGGTPDEKTGVFAGIAGRHLRPLSVYSLKCWNDRYWDPYMDDADAFRLQAIAKINVEFGIQGSVTTNKYDWNAETERGNSTENFSSRENAPSALRWAIIQTVATC